MWVKLFDKSKISYISDGCCTEFNIYHFITSLLTNVLFSIQWCLWKAAFFWKIMLVVIYAKILHHNFIPTTHENFKSVFLLF